MTKIAIISPYPPPIDGIAEHTRHLADAWCDLGCNVLVIAPGRAGPEDIEIRGNLRIHRSLRPMLRSQARNAIESFAPDLVYTQFTVSTLTTNLFSALDLSRVSRKRGSTIAFGFHEPVRELAILGPIGSALYSSGVHVSDIDFVFSRAAADSMRGKGMARNLFQIPLGRPTLPEPNASDIARVCARYGLTGPAVVLALGFIHPDKGLNILLEAASRVSTEVMQPVTFLIAGTPRSRKGPFRLMGQIDQRLYADLKKRAGSLDADIKFSGFIPNEDVAPLMKASTILALPYLKATQSGIASLASAIGVPVIASDLPGLREAFGDGAIYTSPGSTNELADALLTVLNDEEMRSVLATEIRHLDHDDTYIAVAAQMLQAAMNK
jgi:glycosyltransferase involved in cell wall biosynthesis